MATRLHQGMAAWAGALAAAAGIAHAAGGLKDGADCAGFTAADAAAWLKAPAAQVTRSVQKSGPALWLCSFSVGKTPPGIAYSVALAKDAKTAAAEMERYRDDLSTAGETAPFKGKLPKGAYSDIIGVGDEGIWTDVNGSYTVRKGNVTVQFTRPAEKLEQVKLGKAVLAKF